MKKKIVIPVIAMLILIALAAIFYFTPKTFGKNVNPSDVDHIDAFDGNTGVGFTIGNGKAVIPKFILDSDHTIRKDPFFYRCEGGLCFDYIKEIESRTGE